MPFCRYPALQHPLMSEGVEEFTLAVSIIEILYGRYQDRSGRQCPFHHRMHVVNEQADEYRPAGQGRLHILTFFTVLFVHVEDHLPQLEFRHMDTPVFVGQPVRFLCTERSFKKAKVCATMGYVKQRGKSKGSHGSSLLFVDGSKAKGQ